MLAVLVFGFGVPFLAGPGVVVGAVALLVLASIGIGIVDRADLRLRTARPSRSRCSILLASVFFSGLALDLDQFSAPVRAISALLPVTQAGSLLQDLMLRGDDHRGVAGRSCSARWPPSCSSPDGSCCGASSIGPR